MTKYSLPHFPAFDLSALEEYYDVDINFNGNEISIDLNFDGKSIDVKRMDKIKAFIENLAEYDKANKTYITQDYNNEDRDTVKSYVDFHLEDMNEEELSSLIDFSNKSISPEVQLISKLQLVRLGFYPDNTDSFATFDYSIGRELTDQLVVILINENGKLNYMTMES